MKKTLMFALMAGLAAPAMAQSDLDVGPAMDATMNPNLSINWTRPVGYDSRVPGNYPIYDIGIPVTGVAATGGFAGPGGPGGAQAIADDMIIVNNANEDLTINAIKFGIWSSADINAGNPNIYMKLEFFPTHTATAAGTNPGSGTPISSIVNLGTGWQTGGNSGQFFPVFIGLDLAEQVTLPYLGSTSPNTWSVVMSLWSDAAGTVPLCYFAPFSRANYTCIPVGQSDEFRWFASAQSGGLCPYFPGANRSGTTAGLRGAYMAFQATRDAVPPAISTALGSLADNTPYQVNGTIPGTGGTHVISFTLPNGAMDTDWRYLDIDTEGSTANVNIGLFDANTCALIWQDTSAGSGNNAQLSAGMGRRAAVGDGVQYDGRVYSGGPGLPAGDYVLIVAPEGALHATPCLTSCVPAAGGNFTVNVRTNAAVDGLGNTVEPSVEPALREPDFGAIVSPGVPIGSRAQVPYGVDWYKFTSCRDTDATNTLQIDMDTSDISIGHSWHLFNSSGNLVTAAIGGASVPAPVIFNDTNPLPAGTYFLAQTWSGGNQYSPDASNNGRWHLRNTSGNNGFQQGGTIIPSWADCNVGPGCDPDVNQDGNVDQDDVSYLINVVGGGENPTGIDPDFNQDGNVDQDDIAALINTVGGGGCP